MSQAQAAGRFCPPDYRLDAAGFWHATDSAADILYIAGGLYGNTEALTEIERLFRLEQQLNSAARCELVFNGDFHWFDACPDSFAEIEQRTAAHTRLRGNVETELARDGDSSAGCGCAYPDSVPDQAVAWSNEIIELLTRAGRVAIGVDSMRALGRLSAAGTWLIGNTRIAVTHGDHLSLAGWSFAEDRLADTWHDGLAQLMADWAVDVFASSHTCLPVADTFAFHGRPLAVINNGSAGLANASRQPGGILTRIARAGVATAPVRALYETRIGEATVSALPVGFDLSKWRQRFDAIWPEGSAARLAYFDRIMNGPDYTLEQAARGGFVRQAAS